MELDEAVKILNECTRSELRDHAFGDIEIFWMKNLEQVASGYFGGNTAEVWVKENPAFKNEDARKLRECGTLGHIERNDETGPDTFTEGAIMPGLSKGDVFHELTGSYLDES